ncbi:hypothetical protein [Prosthecobacter sp.]|uniref:hypothetical protein n=1 Tax=Prosthecobacter sp. TaxID=1965333 RepID=UPI0037852F96
MNAFRSLLILLVLQLGMAFAQQPNASKKILEGKSIEELRKFAEGLGEGKSSFEFVEAAYASGRDEVVALCWSLNTCGYWCFKRLEESQDPVFRDKQVLMMLRNSGANSGWPDGGSGLLNGAQATLMQALGRMVKDYFPVWNPEYSLLNTPEKRLAFADKLEALMKAKRERSTNPVHSPAPAAVAPPNPAPNAASPPKPQLPVVAPPLEGQEPVAWVPWVSAAAVLLLIGGFLVLRRRK